MPFNSYDEIEVCFVDADNVHPAYLYAAMVLEHDSACYALPMFVQVTSLQNTIQQGHGHFCKGLFLLESKKLAVCLCALVVFW